MKESIKFINKSKKYIYTIALIFLASLLLGFLLANILAPLLNPLLLETIKKAENLNTFSEFFNFIFLNNSMVSLLGMILGIFFGIFPIIISSFNGLLIGYVIKKITETGGFLEIWRLFPHGIFELPAAIISLGIGLKLGRDLIKNFTAKNKKDTAKKVLGIISILFAIIGVNIISNSFKIKEIVPYSNSVTYGLLNIFIMIIGVLFIIPFLFYFFIEDKKIRKINLQNIKEAIKAYIFIILPLLFIAALIESWLIISFK